MAATFSESVLNRGPPEYDWKTGKDEEKYEGEIYQPPPLLKNAFGYIGYHLAMRADYDQDQRKYVPDEVIRAWGELSWREWVRNVVTLQPGLPRRERPFPWRDEYSRAGWCPDAYMQREWRMPRRTNLNKYIPPPKDGVYEDLWHAKQHYSWVLKEWQVYRYETGIVATQVHTCIQRNSDTFNLDCKGLMDVFFNMVAKTNVDKVRSMLWSGVPVVRDGGFHVRY